MGTSWIFQAESHPNFGIRQFKACTDLIVRVVVLFDELVNEHGKAPVNVQELLHGRAGQETQQGNEVGRVSTAHHLVELVAHVHQVQ